MKLAEALLHRKSLQTKLTSIEQRLQQNVLVQEGDQPAEAPLKLLQEALLINTQLHQLIKSIHKTNATATSIQSRPLLDALNERDELLQQHRILQNVLNHVQNTQTRYSANEIRWVKAVPVASLQKQADNLNARIRANNLEVQASNWQVDLMA